MDVCSFAKVESITRETETATGSLYKLTTLGVEVQAPTGTDGMPLYEAVEVPDFSGPASDTYVHCSASMPAVLGHWSDEDLWVMHPLEVGNQDDVFGFNAYAHAVYWYVCHGQNIPADEIYTPEQAVAAENYGYKASWGTTQGQLEFRGLAEIKSYFGQSVPEQPEAGVELVSTGTGFVVSREGDVLTNAHVIEQCQELGISQVGGAPEPATLRAASPEADLALLRASTTPQAIASFRDGERLQQGEDIYVYGFPQFGILASSGNITRGSVAALAGLGDRSDHFQISAAVQAGNSGGPVLDQAGNVIGVVVAQLGLKFAAATRELPQNVNFAIKAATALSFLEAKGVGFEMAPSSAQLIAPQIAAAAQKFTVLVLCYR